MRIETSTWLAATKLRPPAERSDTIKRPHLEAELKRAISTLPVTLLSAPAGYGKTTMLAAIPRLLPDYPLAWITLDPEDNDPALFLRLLVAALSELHPDCGKSALPWISAGATDSESVKKATGAIINDVMERLPDPFVLVLDDLHSITEPAVFTALEYLLSHQPPQMRLAIGTRYDPPLRLARLAGRRELAEIRRADLGFTEHETEQLLNGVLGLGLSGPEVSVVQERTEGWPAGLCLLSGHISRMGPATGGSPSGLSLIRSDRFALDFVSEEVLQNLPGDLRRFLLQTSILPEMTPSICRAVTGREDSGQVLETLYRQNLTIAAIESEEAGEPVYRHHALLARLLSRLLEQEMPGDIAELHRRAALAEKTPGRAISHYLAAGFWDEAARLMVESGAELLALGMSETLHKWCNALPVEERRKHPRLTVLLGRCEIHRGNYSAAAPLLKSACDAFVAAGDVNGEAATVPSLITLAFQNNDRETASSLVDRAMALPLNHMGKMSALLARSWLRISSSDWDGARADFTQALSLLESTGDRPAALMGVTYVVASGIYAVPGCLDLAARFGSAASKLASPDTALALGGDEIGLWPVLCAGQVDEALAMAEDIERRRQRIPGYPVLGNDATVVLSILRLTRGETKAAGDAADRLLHRISNAAQTKRPFYLHAAGRAMAFAGQLAQAKELLNRLSGADDGLPFTMYLKSHLEGLLTLVSGRRDEASAALEQAAERESLLPIAWAGGSARLLKARLMLDEGQAEAAASVLADVLTEWELEGCLGRVLLDAPAILPVLSYAAKAGDSAAARALALLPPLRVTGGGTPPSDLTKLLTSRECEVLKLIVAGRTNREIARELYVTEDTVKSHVAHILRKLDVTSRTQAAIRGRELGL